jgi:hypothetical protein
VNNRSIPSTHPERQINDLSAKHSFTLYPSLSPYRWTESWTEEQIHSLCVGGETFFPVVLLCQFLVLAKNRFWFYILMYLEYHVGPYGVIFHVMWSLLSTILGPEGRAYMVGTVSY